MVTAQRLGWNAFDSRSTAAPRASTTLFPTGSDRRPVTDEALMTAFCAGRDAAFETLFDRYAEQVRTLMLRLTGNGALATELTQATFFSVVKGRGRFVEGSRFKPWLFTIAMNALRDHQRRAKREVLSDEGVLPEGTTEAPLPDRGLERAVHEALSALPAIQREAVVLHQLEGFSFREIAEMVGLSESAVKVRAHRGYARLRSLLKGTWVGHE